MFRGKECSNRIELSRLVQDLLNFGVSGSLRVWGWGVGGCGWGVVGGVVGWGMVGGLGGGWGGGWLGGRVDRGGGWLGVPPTHVHMYTHAHTCRCGKHDNFMQMAAPIGGIPGNSL